MTTQEAIELYREIDQNAGFEKHTYPACIGILNEVIAIADENGDNGSTLEMYDKITFLTWMNLTKQAINNGSEPTEALYETKPKPKVEEGH